MRPGLRGDGPRMLDFAPILDAECVPLNAVLRRLLATAEERLGAAVEIEFAVNLDPDRGTPARLGFLQVRPMQVSAEIVVVDEADLAGDDVLLGSTTVMGNGTVDDLVDVVYVKPEVFEAKYTVRIAGELAEINRALAAEGRSCLLIGFGRWGSSDPWLGVPVDWSQIGAARVIVEATLPEMNPDLSQGSHFFHNLISFKVLYLSVRHRGGPGIDWAWLDAQPVVAEKDFVKHVRCPRPLSVRVDGRGGRGVVTRHE